MPRDTTFSVRASQGGGRLVNIRSVDNVGAANYVAKINWRRSYDGEIPREGHLPFKPNTALSGYASQALSLPTGDVIGIWEAVRPNGDRAVVAASRTTLYRFDYSSGSWSTIGSGFSASTTYWQGEQLDGYLILNNGIDLPVTYRVEASAVVPIHEMRLNGIAAVGCISVYNGFLVCADIPEVSPAELPGIITGGSPYGVVPSSKINRIRYKIAWCDFGAPRNWSPVIDGVIQSATKNKVTLAFPVPDLFPVGTKLAVIGAGPNGGTLGGQSGLDDGVPVTAVNGAEITLSVQADADLTFPLSVQVTRFADTSTFAGSSSIKDDSSSILAVRPLKQVVVVYRETGIWIGRYTGEVETPFQFRPAYRGPNVIAYPRAIADIDGDYHIYLGATDFYYFDGAGNPRIHGPTDDASKLIFNSLTGITAAVADEKVFATHNSVTNEWWFHHPGGVLAFDYVIETVSTIDTEYTAGASVVRPGATGRTIWFVVAAGGKVLQYAAVDSGPLAFTRSNGSVSTPVTCTLTRGELTLNDDESEKDLKSYMPLFSTFPADDGSSVTVTLYGRDNVAATPEQLCSVPLTNTGRKPLVETFFRNVYFHDSVVYVPGSASQPAKLVGCTYTFQGVNSQGVTRNYNGADE